MNAVQEWATALLLLTLLLGLIRVWRGPGFADRILAAQLFGTTGVALLLMLGVWEQRPALINVGLILALLAVLVVVAFVTRVWPGDEYDERP